MREIMYCTSSEAAKLLRKLTEERNDLLAMEEQSCTFLASLGEDVESVRPVYQFGEIQEKLAELERKIRVVKHAVNQFNVTQVVPGTEMTIDQLLVYIPQLTQQKQKLSVMKSRLPKQRDMTFGRSQTMIDYCYANYEISEAEAAWQRVSDELANVQTALDVVNNTVTMEIDL